MKVEVSQYFAMKLACETDCADVYQAMLTGQQDFVLFDVRSNEAFAKSHAQGAVNMPSADISELTMAKYDKVTPIVVYCWGPGCNGATKAAYKLVKMGYQVKEMIGGIHYWEDFERYPVNRRVSQAQS
ncbi:sulfurtransferase [Pseudoalteromonas sp. JC28]|uniref:rhodanese-like domain-containing protein n=1 Tax=Pseudoalteromonas TaxID=53246 RepID=UPI001571E610|nr:MULTISPECIES: rhodanese-like domain-containing protein [Pseudoalteromonas]NSY34339.1 sulfurtransferase [Pseudoalteromonas sp. JC28]WMO12838.1 rhodanese-like domain-containing protein [Pseudoalteromonas piscicida]